MHTDSASYAGFSIRVLRLYDIEKRSAVLEMQLSCMTETRRCQCLALETRKNSVGRRRRRRREEYEKVKRGNGDYDAFPSRELQVAFANIVTLGTLAPWNIHGLELFQSATTSPVLPTRTSTLDRSHHFEPGTFLNRRNYCDF